MSIRDDNFYAVSGCEASIAVLSGTNSMLCSSKATHHHGPLIALHRASAGVVRLEHRSALTMRQQHCKLVQLTIM
jgi:hypothetical protein